MVSFFTSLVNIGSAWTDNPLAALCLKLLGWLYGLISYAFNLFLTVCQLNFNSLYSIISPLVDRLEALTMVFVVFKIAIELINYLIDPDKFLSGSKKLIINILITAVLLISYNFIFSFFNELGMLFTGAPANYPFTTLNQIANVSDSADQGLIMRFVFGSGADSIKDQNIGDYLAYNTLKIVIENTTTKDYLLEAISTKDGINFGKISNLASYLDKGVKYTPFIGSLIGGYMVYTIIKMCIEVATRMFKLLVLQILAPIAIISIVRGGTKDQVFSKYVKTYISVYIEMFVRMFTMLVTVAFISKFLKNIGQFFSNDITTTGKFVSNTFLILIVMAGAFKLLNELPKFIDGILGTHMADSKGGGFGSYVKGLAGYAVGAGSGLLAGHAVGVGGRLAGMIAGGINGARAGSKGNSVAEFFKGQKDVNKANQERANKIARQGGLFQYGIQRGESLLQIPQNQEERREVLADNNKLMQNLMDAKAQALEELSENDRKYTSSSIDGEIYITKDRDAFAKAYGRASTSVRTARSNFDNVSNQILESNQKLSTISDRNSTEYATEKAHRDSLLAQKEKLAAEVTKAETEAEDAGRHEWDNLADTWVKEKTGSEAEIVKNARTDLKKSQRGNVTIDADNATYSGLRGQVKSNNKTIQKMQLKGASARARRQDIFNKK